MSKSDIKRAVNVLKKHKEQLLREVDSIDHVLECSLGNYDFMIDFAIEKGYKRVVDIGCAYGHQSELCQGRIEYRGIDEDFVNFYKIDEDNSYIAAKYPFYMTSGEYKNDLAISNLAIGWKCYVDDNEFRKQCKALASDFKACLLYVPTDREAILKEYFKNIEIYRKTDEKDIVHRIIIPTAFYYCYN